ncbi:MAG: metallophosphoesterase family protein [Pseudomonadota bacterium]
MPAGPDFQDGPRGVRNHRRLFLRQAPPLTYVVGDIHGCRGLFEKMLERICNDAQDSERQSPVLVVLVGDVIDRGRDTAGVLDILTKRRPDEDNLEILCLLGNHEAMLLDIIAGSEPGAVWLGNGGAETLQSYGQPGDAQRFGEMPLRELRRVIDASVPDTHISFLQHCPISLRFPGYLITHSGLSGEKTLSNQQDRDLLWSKPSDLDTSEKASVAREDLDRHNLRLVHGHVPQKNVDFRPHRINVDTGAYSSGKLSALRIPAGQSPVQIAVTGGQD